MTEEVQTEVVVETVVDVESSPSEVKARELGWKPLEEYSGPEEKWVDADEFVSRQPLFEKIDSLKGELWKSKQEHQREFTQIKHHFAEMQEVEFKRAVAYLKTQKLDALDAGDSEKVLEIDDKIDALKDQHAAEKVKQIVPTEKTPDPLFMAWAEKNSWYAQDSNLREDADAFAMAFVNKNSNRIPAHELTKAVLEHVDNKMKLMHPETLGTTMKRTQPASVETSSTSTNSNRGKSKLTVNDLSADEKAVMKMLVERKVRTQEEYIADLAKAKGLN